MDDELRNHRGPAAKRTELERCKSYFTKITVMANERLGQLARFFDLRHETGQWSPRPGKEARPEWNAANIQDSPSTNLLTSGGFSAAATQDTSWWRPPAAGTPICLVTAVQTPGTRYTPSSAQTFTSRQSRWAIQGDESRGPTRYHNAVSASKATLNTGRVMPEVPTQSTAKSEVSLDVEMHDADDSGRADADFESDPDYASPPAFGIHQADDDEAMEGDTDETYAIEALLDHRPPFSSRRNARYYKRQESPKDAAEGPGDVNGESSEGHTCGCGRTFARRQGEDQGLGGLNDG
ncbi:hypothetical protein DL766_007260 [Monosporascus sp. MC13-8B]|uniref:Uncharacterized protein n=1 Tax=Monosporascus cannonballus TaxID=155416 RepID=A0ABY0H4D4_9PEZI|nr:hypothetical protein DL762_006820 [Monosporascus cannonballus]RYO83361.1 hypothetical protein DL763_007896 [Monosporascus cannonballus]RYP24566.1 hypothetical protein DL766_007260 [Monosporascus sp. MC13-8B]